MGNFQFNQKSLEKLDTAHRQLQIIAIEAIKISPVDFSIIWGHRGQQTQNIAFQEGKSRVQWPRSAHNREPSDAIDICPWVKGKLDWDDERKFYMIAGIFLGMATMYGFRIKWGGAWDGNLNAPYKLNDLGHIERIVRANGQ